MILLKGTHRLHEKNSLIPSMEGGGLNGQSGKLYPVAYIVISTNASLLGYSFFPVLRM